MKLLTIYGICVLAMGGVDAAQPPTNSKPNMPPSQTKPSQLWQDDFNPQTRDERVDTDTSTDEDVIIMEEDEDSENLPGNTENAPQ